MITVVGWPRSGTHWLRAMLQNALGEDLLHSHALPETGKGEYVLIVRNPLDAFASHWRLYQNDHPGTSRTEAEHLRLFMEAHVTTPHLCGGWVPHTLKLLGFRGIHPLVRHEALREKPEETLIQVLSGLQRDVPQLRYIVQAVQDTRGVRCDPSTLPVDADMSAPGKWRSQLQPETVQALLDYCGELMDELGYTR